MTHTARAVFTFKSAETKAAFINFCSGERGLDITRAWEGCISIECYESADNPLEMTIWQKWESASYLMYINHYNSTVEATTKKNHQTPHMYMCGSTLVYIYIYM